MGETAFFTHSSLCWTLLVLIGRTKRLSGVLFVCKILGGSAGKIWTVLWTVFVPVYSLLCLWRVVAHCFTRDTRDGVPKRMVPWIAVFWGWPVVASVSTTGCTGFSADGWKTCATVFDRDFPEPAAKNRGTAGSGAFRNAAGSSCGVFVAAGASDTFTKQIGKLVLW